MSAGWWLIAIAGSIGVFFWWLAHYLERQERREVDNHNTDFWIWDEYTR